MGVIISFSLVELEQCHVWTMKTLSRIYMITGVKVGWNAVPGPTN